MQSHATDPWVLNVYRATITMAGRADSRGRRDKLTRTSVRLKARYKNQPGGGLGGEKY